MGSTLSASAIDKLLRDRYPEDDEVWPQFNTGAAALDLLTSGRGLPKYGRADAEGRRLRIPVRTGGNPNAAVPVREGRGYPTTGNQSYDEAIYNIIEFFQSFQISGLARAKSPGGAKSVRNAFELEMTSQMENAKQRLNKAIHSDGSGLLAVCASVSGNVITLAAVSAGTDFTNLPIGREVMVANLTTGAFPTGHPAVGVALVISARNTATPSITVLNEDGTVPTLTGITSSFGVYLLDAQGNDLPGLGVMCSASDPSNYGGTVYYGSISRASNDFWKAVEVDAAIATVKQVISVQRHVQPLLAAIDKACGQKFGGRLFGFCGYDVWYGLANSMARNQRTNYNVSLKGGYEGIQYNNLVAVIDFMAAINELRAVSPRTTYRYIMDEWFWEDETGSIMSRVSTSTGRPTNVFRLDMCSRQTMASVQCITNGRIKNLAATQ